MKNIRSFDDSPYSRFSKVKYPTKLKVGGKTTQARYDNMVNRDTEGLYSSISEGLEGGSSSDIAGGLNKVLPYASNMVNSFRKLPSPIAPVNETYMTPALVNYDATRNQINQQVTGQNREIDYKVNNATVRQALKAGTLSANIEGLNQVGQAEGNTNAQIKNQTSLANQGVQARNIERRQRFNDQILSRNLKQQELSAENLANFSDKYQMQQRDNTANDLEREKLDIIRNSFEKDENGNTVMDRNLMDQMRKSEERMDKFSGGYNRYGGKIKKFPLGGKIDPDKPIKGFDYQEKKFDEQVVTFKQSGVGADSVNYMRESVYPVRKITNPSLSTPPGLTGGIRKLMSKNDTDYVGSEDPTRFSNVNRDQYIEKLDNVVRSPAFIQYSKEEGYTTPKDFAGALINEYDTEAGTRYDIGDTYNFRRVNPPRVNTRPNKPTKMGDKGNPLYPREAVLKYGGNIKRLY